MVAPEESSLPNWKCFERGEREKILMAKVLLLGGYAAPKCGVDAEACTLRRYTFLRKLDQTEHKNFRMKWNDVGKGGPECHTKRYVYSSWGCRLVCEERPRHFHPLQ